MPVLPLSSQSDPRLDPYRTLKSTAGQTLPTVIAEGEKLVLRLLASRWKLISIVSTEAMLERLSDQIPPEVPIYLLAAQEMSQLVGFAFHRGVLACAEWPAALPLHALTERLTSATQGLLVLCPEIKDPENFGTIARTAAAFGALGIVAGLAGTDPYSRRVLRTSMGAVLQLPVVQTDDWEGVLQTLHAWQYETVATVLDPSADPLSTANYGSKIAIVLGNEAEGIPPAICQHCRRLVTMPMAAGVDSLNVAVAAGIVLHHFAGRLCHAPLPAPDPA